MFLFYRLAWDFSVGQLSSKVLKSSQLVRSFVCTEIETYDLMSAWLTLSLCFVGYMFGWSGSESAAVWRCEPTRDEARLFVPECEDAYSRAAWRTVSQPTPAAPVSQKERSRCIWWAKCHIWQMEQCLMRLSLVTEKSVHPLIGLRCKSTRSIHIEPNQDVAGLNV